MSRNRQNGMQSGIAQRSFLCLSLLNLFNLQTPNQGPFQESLATLKQRAKDNSQLTELIPSDGQLQKLQLALMACGIHENFENHIVHQRGSNKFTVDVPQNNFLSRQCSFLGATVNSLSKTIIPRWECPRFI